MINSLPELTLRHQSRVSFQEELHLWMNKSLLILAHSSDFLNIYRNMRTSLEMFNLSREINSYSYTCVNR